MKFDSGSLVSSISIHNFKKLFSEKKIKGINEMFLKTCTGKKINLIGFYKYNLRSRRKTVVENCLY